MSLTPGTHLGPYEIVGFLGKGGMGEVYQARDPRLNRMLALKVLSPDRMGRSERRQRFIQEAQLASSLQHPNIITIYEIGSVDGVDYIAMELVRGRTLDALIPHKGLRLNEALRIAGQVAEALTAAHAAGVVHRDLKPGNIMVTDTGAVKVLDFGLAKMTEAVPSEFEETQTLLPAVETDDGIVLGSAAYMSPEQAEGKLVDARSDIFAFGAILYEMLSGHRAFAGDSKMSILAAVITAEPKPLADEGLPHEVERIVARCLRKDVSRRAQHMADVRLALDELREESESGALTAPETSQRARAKRVWWIAGAVLAWVLIVGAIVWWQLSNTPELAFDAVPLTTYPGSEEGPSFSPDGSQVAYRGNQNKQWDIYVKVIGSGPPLRLTSDSGVHSAPAWSPDGRWIAFTAQHADGRSGVIVMPALGGPERLLTELDGFWPFVDWSPDAKWIAVSPNLDSFDTHRGVSLISAQSGERRELAKEYPELARSSVGRFSPDGKKLVFTRQRGNQVAQLYVADLTPGLRLAGKPYPITPDGLELLFPAWTADGREIVFMLGSATSNGSLARVRADGRGPVRKILGLGYTTGPIDIARKGGRMAFSRGGIDSDIWRFDTKGEESPRRWVASTLFDIGGEYSQDGKKIAFSSNRSGSREIWVCDADGGNAAQLTHFGGPTAGTPRWSPDGRQIAFDARPGGNPDIFVIGAEGSGMRRLTYEPGEDARPAWSADGKLIYFSSDRDGRSQIWRVPSAGGAAEQVTKNGGSSAYPSPDGEWIYYERSTLTVGPLRRIRPDGGGDRVAVDRPIHFLQYVPMPGGVYFVALWKEKYRLERLLPNGNITDLLELSFFPGLGLSLTPDERYVLITKPDENGTDLMMVEGFR